jgi:sec-independent protein translocase protein TatA
MATNLLTPTHVACVLFVLLLLFGAQRLPQIGRELGRGMREFKAAITGSDADADQTQALGIPPDPPQGTTPTRGGTS